jgi:mannose/fructose-specific phosphotransferase system component IIA
MSEGSQARGILVTHGALAEGLLSAVAAIVGKVGDALTAVSNTGLSPDALLAEVRSRLGPGPNVIFTDLHAGSCTFAARRICGELPGVALISGTNLAVLLDFVTHRELPMEELVPRLVEKGRAAICCAPADLEKYAHRALSSR